MHVSNRHLDLAPVAAAAALATPGTHVAIVKQQPGSRVARFGPIGGRDRDQGRRGHRAGRQTGREPRCKPAATVTAWTDDYSDIVSALWRVYGAKK